LVVFYEGRARQLRIPVCFSVIVIVPAVLTGLMVTPRRMVMTYPLPSPLSHRKIQAHEEQYAGSHERENMFQRLFDFESGPSDQKPDQGRHQYMARSRDRRYGQGAPPRPTPGLSHQNERNPVGRDRCMQKRHRESGDGDGKQSSVVHRVSGGSREPTTVTSRCGLSTANSSKVVNPPRES